MGIEKDMIYWAKDVADDIKIRQKKEIQDTLDTGCVKSQHFREVTQCINISRMKMKRLAYMIAGQLI